MVGLDYDWIGTSSVMTCVLLLSADVRRSERVKWAVMEDFPGICK
jgi:hypothetical protein